MFHKEGYTIIFISLICMSCLFLVLDFIGISWLIKTLQIVLLIVFILILQFFRNPKRHTSLNDAQVISPVDGKVVIIKEVEEPEYFNDKRMQVSVFMSPLNIHVTRYPVGGKVVFSKYHPGKYFVAWHPKSSEKNERTTIVVENPVFGKVLYRQIAGAVARRIVNYAKTKQTVVQGTDAGFIKFGSRVDLFLPLDTKIEIKLNQKVRGGETIIAKL